MSVPELPVDPGLLRRFQAAGGEIAWRSAPSPPRGPRRRAARPRGDARIAHLHDEEARVEEEPGAIVHRLVTDSGPVGALVILLEIDRRGLPGSLRTHEAGALPAFPQGALEARWGSPPKDGETQLPLRDLVELARYALA